MLEWFYRGTTANASYGMCELVASQPWYGEQLCFLEPSKQEQNQKTETTHTHTQMGVAQN